MAKEIIISADTVDEALEEALRQLEATRDEVEVEVLVQPEKKIFGSNVQAKIRVSLISDRDDESTEDEEPAEEGGDRSEGEPEEDLDEDEVPLVEDDVEPKEENYNEALNEVSEDELDAIADTAIETLRGILSYFGIESAEIEEYEGDEGELILDIVGENLAVLIGRHGKTLDSLQFIVSSIVNKKLDIRYPIIIDIEGYKHRRKQKLISIAKSSAARAIRQKHEVHLRPMTPYERRIVHVALKSDKRIVTNSEGTEPYRYVVIELA